MFDLARGLKAALPSSVTSSSGSGFLPAAGLGLSLHIMPTQCQLGQQQPVPHMWTGGVYAWGELAFM